MIILDSKPGTVEPVSDTSWAGADTPTALGTDIYYAERPTVGAAGTESERGE